MELGNSKSMHETIPSFFIRNLLVAKIISQKQYGLPQLK